MEKLLRIEAHCHTIYSKDSLTQVQDLLDSLEAKGLDRIVITDHNTMIGAARAYELDPERVIRGEEIMTTSGEILAFAPFQSATNAGNSFLMKAENSWPDASMNTNFSSSM